MNIIALRELVLKEEEEWMRAVGKALAQDFRLLRFYPPVLSSCPKMDCCQLFILISGVLGTISQRVPGPSSLQVLG